MNLGFFRDSFQGLHQRPCSFPRRLAPQAPREGRLVDPPPAVGADDGHLMDSALHPRHRGEGASL